MKIYTRYIYIYIFLNDTRFLTRVCFFFQVRLVLSPVCRQLRYVLNFVHHSFYRRIAPAQALRVTCNRQRPGEGSSPWRGGLVVPAAKAPSPPGRKKGVAWHYHTKQDLRYKQKSTYFAIFTINNNYLVLFTLVPRNTTRGSMGLKPCRYYGGPY